MSEEELLKRLEGTISGICLDIRKGRTGAGADKLDSLAKLVNSYSRLLERSKKPKPERDPLLYGDPDYVDALSEGM